MLTVVHFSFLRISDTVDLLAQDRPHLAPLTAIHTGLSAILAPFCGVAVENQPNENKQTLTVPHFYKEYLDVKIWP